MSSKGVCEVTGEERFLTKYAALLVAPQRNPRSPLSKLASSGQGAYECEHCGWWHRIPVEDPYWSTRRRR